MVSSIISLVGTGGVFLLLYFVLRAASFFVSRLSERRYRAYRRLAKRYRGRYEPRGFGEPPTVGFLYNGALVRVGLAPVVPRRGPPYPRSRVVARIGRLNKSFRMELIPASPDAIHRSPRGARQVLIGDVDFDRSFQLFSNDPELATSVFDLSGRRAVENLGRLAFPASFLVSIDPDRMMIQIDRDMGTDDELLGRMVYESLVLLDALGKSIQARMSKGITIKEVGAANFAETGPPICKVCGDPILPKARRVVCAACRTPYHHDCWEYIGGCSIFGCQGKMSVAV